MIGLVSYTDSIILSLPFIMIMFTQVSLNLNTLALNFKSTNVFPLAIY